MKIVLFFFNLFIYLFILNLWASLSLSFGCLCYSNNPLIKGVYLLYSDDNSKFVSYSVSIVLVLPEYPPFSPINDFCFACLTSCE